MARKPSVRYFQSRSAYYCQFNGRQHKLAEGPDDSPTGPTFLAALEAFTQVMAMGRVETAGAGNTVEVIIESYFQHGRGKDGKPLDESTITKRLYLLQPFVDEVGDVPVGSLTHFQVWRFLDKQRVPRKVKKRSYSWGASNIASFFEAANAVFNWAVRSNLIPKNPLVGMGRLEARSRSRDCLVSPEQHKAILQTLRSPAMRNLVIALENTGARPSELINATAKDWDDEAKAIVYYGDDRRRQDDFRHKTARHKKDRFIHFTGEALDMVRRLVKERPTGVLFPSSRGTPYGEKSVQSCFEAFRDRVGMPKLTAYSYRHTMATNWLLAGKSIDILAELLGNTPAIIRKHYAHLCSNRKALRQQLEEFAAART
jgi:integrase